MKQHPVDDLFARRLEDHRLEPRRASWDEMQRRMNPEPERRLGIAWYAVAAGIALALLAGWWVWRTNEAPGFSKQPELAVEPSPKAGSPERTSSPVPNGTTTKAIKQAATADQAMAYAQAERKPAQVKATAKPAQLAEEQELELIAQQPAAPKEEPSVLKAEPKLEKAVASAAASPERTLIVQIQEPVLVAQTAAPAPEQELAEEEQPRKKRVRLGRLVRQFNNLREGEPVDWSEAGLQPGALLAKAADKVQEGKEKITQSYESLRTQAFSKNAENNK